MKKLSDAVKKVTSKKKYANELFYTDDSEFFILYDDKIAHREDPVYSYDGIYKITPETNKLIEEYCKKIGIEIAELEEIDPSEYASDLCYDNDTLKELVDTDEVNAETSDFIKHFIDQSEITSLFRAVDMLIQNCEVGQWYMDFRDAEYVSIVDSIAISSDIIECINADGEVEEYWLEILDDIDSYIFEDGVMV